MQPCGPLVLAPDLCDMPEVVERPADPVRVPLLPNQRQALFQPEARGGCVALLSRKQPQRTEHQCAPLTVPQLLEELQAVVQVCLPDSVVSLVRKPTTQMVEQPGPRGLVFPPFRVRQRALQPALPLALVPAYAIKACRGKGQA